ncbi:MAG: ATPase, T2SS/T4P/T4SS family [Candidatus Acidiferrum sp.]
MLRLSRIFKSYNETGSLGERINLYGFIGPHVFLAKSGEVGVILEVRGVDYECLDAAATDGLTKRLESALKLFDEHCRVYQYLFKRNNEAIPYQLYGNPVVDAAIKNRIAYLAGKADRLYSLSVYYVILFEGFRTTEKLGNALAAFLRNPKKAAADLRAQFSGEQQIVVLGQHVSKAQAALLQKARSFILQVRDFLAVRILDKQEAFCVLKRTLNFHPDKLALARLQHDTFLDYYLPESPLECHRGHLRVDDYYVKVLTLKEPSAQSFPLIFKRLLDVQANYCVVTEWKKEDSGKMRRVIQAKRRHFHNTKRSLASQVSLNDAAPQDVLLDDSKESQVRELGESLKEIELNGNYFGQFSLTVVIHDLDLAKVDRACAEFYKVFSVHDAQLYEEKYNLLNAFLAAVPGNHACNLRSLYLLNTNYADFSFLFTLNCGEPRNHHLRQEYLAVLETNHLTPYYLNLHYRDVAHTMILGRTGAGKTSLLNVLGKFIPADERVVLIEDTSEIHMAQDNLVRFEARQALNGWPAITIRDLLKASLRHRPDRIILGEIRGGEAFDLLQLLNTGHSGSLSTVHASSAKQGLARFTSCVLQSGVDLPYRAVKTSVADSVNIVVHLERRPGRRFVSEVVEIHGYDPDRDEFNYGFIFDSHKELV